ncbi:MAG TPA: 16S rRNA (guanine(966)-N(2))-methyltransferase RsmD [Vulgatibacter sp.]|nr:16S rRNA (guanine(966)-N(2))-methyltransferase RsmD [Vulgatibacter sp.]
MRIVAGSAKGRRLAAPAGTGTRPTSDRIRESIFDILGQRFDGGAVLDLFAGSGAMGLEAISRGAERAVLVERGREAAAICEANAASLGFRDRVEVLRADAAGALRTLEGRGARFDLVFLDPPYAEGPGPTLELLGASGLLSPCARVVAEHARRSPPGDSYATLVRTDLRTFGEPAVSFYEREGAPT